MTPVTPSPLVGVRAVLHLRSHTGHAACHWPLCRGICPGLCATVPSPARLVTLRTGGALDLVSSFSVCCAGCPPTQFPGAPVFTPCFLCGPWRPSGAPAGTELQESGRLWPALCLVPGGCIDCIGQISRANLFPWRQTSAASFVLATSRFTRGMGRETASPFLMGSFEKIGWSVPLKMLRK